MSGGTEGLVKKARRAYRNKSLPGFLYSSLQFGARTIARAGINTVRYPRHHTWEIATSTATFHCDSFGEARSLLDTIDPEREPIARLIEAGEEGDVFFDVGAHLGVYSCFIGNAVDLDGLYAFEAHAKTARKLARNLDVNDIDAEVVNKAMSNEAGRSKLLVNEGEVGELEATMIRESSAEARGEVEEVDVVTGDEFIEEHDAPVPNLMKIDVEGEEYEVLEGLASTLSDDHCRVLYCEIHERGGVGDVEARGHRGADVIELIESHGFEIKELGIYPGGTQVLGEK